MADPNSPTDDNSSTPKPPPIIALEHCEGYVCVHFPAQRADGMACRALYESTVALTDQHHVCLVVDFTGIDLVSSGMMGMLVTVRKKFLGSGGQLRVVIPNPRVMEQFNVLNMGRVLDLCDSRDIAITSFK